MHKPRTSLRCVKLPHDTRRVFLRMRAGTTARASVTTPSLFMCKNSVRARSSETAVRARTPASASVNAPSMLPSLTPVSQRISPA